jgi:hypothetical protein
MTAPSPALQELRQTRKQIDALCERIYARCREAAPELFAQLEPLIKRGRDAEGPGCARGSCQMSHLGALSASAISTACSMNARSASLRPYPRAFATRSTRSSKASGKRRDVCIIAPSGSFWGRMGVRLGMQAGRTNTRRCRQDASQTHPVVHHVMHSWWVTLLGRVGRANYVRLTPCPVSYTLKSLSLAVQPGRARSLLIHLTEPEKSGKGETP